MKRFLFFILLPCTAAAQFAPAAGQPGTTAIHKDSSAIVSWAKTCHVVRGLQDISNPNSGMAGHGDSSNALGKADGINVVSLGDGGHAVLTFSSAIKNEAGPDFCVFENAFHPGFLELAFVEVSSDGTNFFRFPATCNVQNTVQIGPFDTSSVPSKIHNLAGKYAANYGVPFDLQDLAATPGLDISKVTHVKIVDVVGCIQPQFARYDSNNNIINDLWSTPFNSGGFDLDAVGVIHQQPVGLKELDVSGLLISLWPSPVSSQLYVQNSGANLCSMKIRTLDGKEWSSVEVAPGIHEIDVSGLAPGLYFAHLMSRDAVKVIKFLKD